MYWTYGLQHALHEKCPNTEFFLVRMQENPDQEKLRIWTLFSQWWLYNVLISLSGDFQLNPEHKDKSSSAFSIFHWNLNSITAHNYAEVLLLEAYIAVHKFDIVCMSQTYLDSSNAYDDGNLEIAGYNLINIWPSIEYKRGAVCIYYKNFSPLFTFHSHLRVWVIIIYRNVLTLN